jgi:hypothetical protein
MVILNPANSARDRSLNGICGNSRVIKLGAFVAIPLGATAIVRTEDDDLVRHAVDKQERVMALAGHVQTPMYQHDVNVRHQDV